MKTNTCENCSLENSCEFFIHRRKYSGCNGWFPKGALLIWPFEEQKIIEIISEYSADTKRKFR